MRPTPDTYRARRRRLSEAVDGRRVVLFGHRPVARNFAANVYPFRQDSTFLYLSGVHQPDAALAIDAGGRTTLYLPPVGPDDRGSRAQIDLRLSPGQNLQPTHRKLTGPPKTADIPLDAVVSVSKTVVGRQVLMDAFGAKTLGQF